MRLTRISPGRTQPGSGVGGSSIEAACPWRSVCARTTDSAFGDASALRSGNQQQRAAVAVDLALLNPDAPLVDVTAPAHRQAETCHQFF